MDATHGPTRRRARVKCSREEGASVCRGGLCAAAATSVKWGQDSIFAGLLQGRISAARRQLSAVPGSRRGASMLMAASELESGGAAELSALARRGSLSRLVFLKRSAGCGQVERELAVNCARTSVLHLLTPPSESGQKDLVRLSGWLCGAAG